MDIPQLLCDCCKKKFNPRFSDNFSYHFDINGREIICCNLRCQTVVLASIAATKSFVETMLSVNLQN